MHRPIGCIRNRRETPEKPGAALSPPRSEPIPGEIGSRIRLRRRFDYPLCVQAADRAASLKPANISEETLGREVLRLRLASSFRNFSPARRVSETRSFGVVKSALRREKAARKAVNTIGVSIPRHR